MLLKRIKNAEGGRYRPLFDFMIIQIREINEKKLISLAVDVLIDYIKQKKWKILVKLVDKSLMIGYNAIEQLRNCSNN